MEIEPNLIYINYKALILVLHYKSILVWDECETNPDFNHITFKILKSY